MRLDPSQALKKCGKTLLIGYAILSVIYTASFFYINYSSGYRDSPIFPRARNAVESAAAAQGQVLGFGNKNDNEQTVVWSSSQGATQPMPESFIMSKVFSDSMGPSDMTPFFFRATETFEKEDITMATLVTRNRFPVLSRLASNHRGKYIILLQLNTAASAFQLTSVRVALGPISAAVHINDDDAKDDTMKELRELYSESPDMQKYVDIHLIVDKYDRQFNMWRNVAKLFARTDYIMMLDVDFHICTDLRKSIRNNTEAMDRLRSGRTALVVPAFEYIEQKDGLDWHTFPTDKSSLLQLVQEEKLGMFHRSWFKGHGSTNYTRWYGTDELYKVTSYDFSYEPYIVYKKESSPWCDERFIGYGANKAACLYEIYLSGIEYWVLPHDFLIHQTHLYPEDERRKEVTLVSFHFCPMRSTALLSHTRV